MTLAELRVGDRAKVVKIGGSGAIKRRLLDMGFTAGSEILVERYAPLLDYALRNVNSLRSSCFHEC